MKMQVEISQSNGPAQTIDVPVGGAVRVLSVADAAGSVSGGANVGAGSEMQQMMLSHPISLWWRYPQRAALAAAVVEKAFTTHRVEVKKQSDGSRTVLSQGTVAADATPVVYVELGDGSCVYETYMDKINTQAQGRAEPLDGYAFEAEMVNDLRAIGFKYAVDLYDAANPTNPPLRIWPLPPDAGFGPPSVYQKFPDGHIEAGRGAEGDITIQDLR